MPHINRIRVNNVKYNFGTQYYDDFVMRFSGKNTIYDLANGGGKSVLMLLLLQNLIPNCTLDEKQPIEKLFRSGNGNTTIHSMIEWKLNPCHVKNGFQYMTTGFCARKARGASGEEGDAGADRTSIDYFNYCIFYRQFNDNDLKNLPLSNGKERITYLGLRSYLQELEKKDFHVEVKIFDRKGEYQNFISNYGLFESEWEIVRGINKTEGHVRTYFETNYRTTRKVVEDLLLEEIIEKSFYRKTGADKENGGMACTLLDLKEQLILLSQKKSEIHYYDRQTELLTEFTGRMANLQGMYLKKQGLEEQLIKTYNTTLLRREQKEQAHERFTEKEIFLEEQKKDISCRMDAAEILKKEYEAKSLELNANEKERQNEAATLLCEKKEAQLEARECDNYYLNYVEYEKEYLTAKQAVDAILSGSHVLAADLCALANELKAVVDARENALAVKILELQEKLSELEECQAFFENEQNTQAVNCRVLTYKTEKLEQEISKIETEIKGISQMENLLFYVELKQEREKAERECLDIEKHMRQTDAKIKQCEKELYDTQVEIQVCQREERKITTELERRSMEMVSHGELKERMNRLVGIYGGTYESVENIIFQQQKELVLLHRQHGEERKHLQEKLQAFADGVMMPKPRDVNAYLEEIVRYYDESAVSGYEYLCSLEAYERELLMERYPQICCGVVTGANLESILADRKLQEKDLGEVLIPVISREALEKQKDLHVEHAMIYIGRKEKIEKIKERLEKLEEILSREYERERVLKQDYNFVQTFLRDCEIYEPKQNMYEDAKKKWKALEMEIEELSQKIRGLNEKEEILKNEFTESERKLSSWKLRAKNLRCLEELEEKKEDFVKEQELVRVEINKAKQSFEESITEGNRIREQADEAQRTLSAARVELRQMMELRDKVKNYTNEQPYQPSGLELKALEIAFLGKKTAYEQKNSDISDKQKLMESCKKAMEQQEEQLKLRGLTVEDMEEKQGGAGCLRTDTEALLLLKKEVFEAKQQRMTLQKEKNELNLRLHKTLGSIQHAKQLAETQYGEIPMLQILPEQLDDFTALQKAQLQEISKEKEEGQKKLRQLEEQCYALKAMAQDMERMMKSAGICPENIGDCLETGMSLKEQYEELRQAYENIVKEEASRLESLKKEKHQLILTLEKMDAYELAVEIEKNIQPPENEQQITEQLEALKTVIQCLELEKDRIGKDMDSLQELKNQFEAQCLQNCLNMKAELDRLQKLSKISMDGQLISMITLQVPYIKEELYEDAMAEYIDHIIRQVEHYESQAEQLNFIRSQLAFKKLFSVIVTNMDAIRLTLYKRERMKEQSRYLRYEEAVGSTGQSQGIYIQFLVAIINYISSINSGNADPLELKKVIFIDNPFGAAKDVYIWEPIFKLLKANNVQLVVPARGATPAITGHFEVNYILGQKLIDGRQQTVVVDYRSQTEESEMEYAVLDYNQETLQFV